MYILILRYTERTTTTTTTNVMDYSAAITQLRGHFTKSRYKTVAQLNAFVVHLLRTIIIETSQLNVTKRLIGLPNIFGFVITQRRVFLWLFVNTWLDSRLWPPQSWSAFKSSMRTNDDWRGGTTGSTTATAEDSWTFFSWHRCCTKKRNSSTYKLR